MGYALGIDVGTSYTAAAIARDGELSMAQLGSDGAVVPSEVVLAGDGVLLVRGDALPTSADEHGSVARAFKRRIGDPDPVLLGGTPYPAEVLTACLLRWTVDRVTDRVGTAPDRLAVTHPAHWGPYKLDLLTQAVRLADVKVDSYVTEPHAAATWIARTDVADGAVVAVYDLGGATFDACVLRKTAVGFDILGRPDGVDRLGGVDFDRIVLAHVASGMEGVFDALDHNDLAIDRLRDACARAKETVSVHDRASIEVVLPEMRTTRLVTRHDIETLLHPSIAESVAALRRALRSAGLVGADVDAVLLVGGSSRIPLVAQLVGEELGRPVGVSPRPKEAVALGAALAARRMR